MDEKTNLVRVTWDTDTEDDAPPPLDLPEFVAVPENIDDEDVPDFLSDTTGWLVIDWQYI